MKLDGSVLKNITSEHGVNMFTVVKWVFMAYVVTVILFLAFAVVITYTNFPEKLIPAVVVVSTALSILLAGGKVSSRAKSRGWLNGAVAGVVYMLILYVISCVTLKGFSFDIYVVYMFALGIISGALGGIIGINLKKSKG